MSKKEKTRKQLDLASRMKIVRKKLGLTQEAMIQQLKQNATYTVKTAVSVTNWEKCHTTPGYDYLEAFCRCFDVEPNYLFTGEKPIFKGKSKNGGPGEPAVEEMWTELEEGLREEEFVYDVPVDFPTFSRSDLESPETVKTMLRYFVNNEEVRANVLLNFVLMIKPGIDRKFK
ncbi:MAG: helix-turn-helix transcriptional regulator, partial [bacterium]|nr:helix-turn-helix transcriptional regulator [bacterium]